MRGKDSWGYNFVTYENVCICNYYRVSDNFRMVVKFSWSGKDLLDGVKGTTTAVKCVRSNS